MNRGSRRTVTRVALLQDYAGRPEKLLDDLEEVAAKGYQGVDSWVHVDDVGAFRVFCERASALGLSVGAGTSYMIGQYKYIEQHPDQRFIPAEPGVDVDGLGMEAWGCPYHPEFKKRYFDMLRTIASFPGMARIWVNDEADMATGCYCAVCMADYARDLGGEMPRLIDPTEENWRDERWRRFLKWRIDRWNNVHGEMAEVVHEVNPDVVVGFQTSPAADMWWNPWYTAIDLHGMSRQLDALSVDPYYTSHKPKGFMPLEVYLSEWCRFLTGVVAKGKRTQIIVQGFSHPNFTRPLNEADGIWSALVPPACGADMIMPYSYTLQRSSPVQEPYERCFEFDSYFERTRPMKYATIVHGLKTEVYARPLPRYTTDSYDGTRLFPVSESLRHHGVPYDYFPDGRLDEPDAPAEYQVVVLPQIDCLSEAEARGVRSFVERGGNVVILGALGVCDEIGSRHGGSLLEELTGIRIVREHGEERAVSFREDLPVAEEIQTVDEHAANYWEGSFRPVCRLRHCVDVEAPSDAEILARFSDDEGNVSDQPAVVSLRRGGRILWFGGFPSRNTVNPTLGSEVQNMAYHWFSALVEWAAGSKPALRVEGWPPMVPMRRLRPVDRRHMSTFEFFPLEGDGIFLGLVTSYFREPTTFPMVLDVPEGKRLKGVRELLDGEETAFRMEGSSARVTVEMGFDTPAKLFLFELMQQT